MPKRVEEEEGDGRGKGGVTARALSNFLPLLITFQSRTPIRLTSSTLTHLYNVRRNAAGARGNFDIFLSER